MRQSLLDVIHETRYQYDAPVELAQHVTYLRPIADHAQEVLRHTMAVAPEPAWQKSEDDAFGNRRMFFSLYTPHRELVVMSQSRVAVRARFDDIELSATQPWEDVVEALRYRRGQTYGAQDQYVFASPFVPLHREVTNYARQCFAAGRPVAEGAFALMERIYHDFDYQADSTDVSTPLLSAFRKRHGVCQDFAHILIAGVRGLGLAARYVSGYLLTYRPDDGVAYIGADASHAWVQVHCPGLGVNDDWLDLDPTNNLIPAAGHITLALGRDYGDVTPLRGVIRGGGDHLLSVAVSVSPVQGQPASR